MGFRIWKKSKGIWIGKSFPSLLYGFIMLVFIGLLFSQTMGIFVCQLFFDVSFFSSDSVVNILDPSILNSLKLIQFFNAFGVFILPSLFFFSFQRNFYNRSIEFKSTSFFIYFFVPFSFGFNYDSGRESLRKFK